MNNLRQRKRLNLCHAQRESNFAGTVVLFSLRFCPTFSQDQCSPTVQFFLVAVKKFIIKLRLFSFIQRFLVIVEVWLPQNAGQKRSKQQHLNTEQNNQMSTSVDLFSLCCQKPVRSCLRLRTYRTFVYNRRTQIMEYIVENNGIQLLPRPPHRRLRFQIFLF